MTSRQTIPEPPVTLPDPTRPPRPAARCGGCQALHKQRAEAEEAGNVRRAAMFEIEIRRHPRHQPEKP